ncbi:hypothetical protein N7468_000006 [Penicillium chermesinum]|uniref:Uncharacterized protein n=1 Tax=Penicillium chermesinum TaxID=63820 RepID=A0A9W9TYW3_9EURO|nr:uncharacterized protein N7468_000006 [Penicillium chermesinum]KAJ5248555.1 hypothetical protein N7468_000006 [Penicillium chermesinum]
MPRAPHQPADLRVWPGRQDRLDADGAALDPTGRGSTLGQVALRGHCIVYHYHNDHRVVVDSVSAHRDELILTTIIDNAEYK